MQSIKNPISEVYCMFKLLGSGIWAIIKLIWFVICLTFSWIRIIISGAILIPALIVFAIMGFIIQVIQDFNDRWRHP